jgi:hypothetical protein
MESMRGYAEQPLPIPGHHDVRIALDMSTLSLFKLVTTGVVYELHASGLPKVFGGVFLNDSGSAV